MLLVHEIKQTAFKIWHYNDRAISKLQYKWKVDEKRTEIDTNLGSLSPKNASISEQMVRQM